MTANQAPTRTREEQELALCKTILGGLNFYSDATPIAKQHIAEAEARARSEAEGVRGEPVYQMQSSQIMWRDIDKETYDRQAAEKADIDVNYGKIDAGSVRILYTSAPDDQAEIERLRAENARLRKAAEALVQGCEYEFAGPATYDDPDDSAVGSRLREDGIVEDMRLTFGHIRDVRRALASAPAQGGEG